VHDRVQVFAGNNGNSNIFVSHGGALVVAAGEFTSRLAWMARDGSTRLVTKNPMGFGSPRMSPDQSRVAMLITSDGKSDVWTLDLATNTLSRLTTVGTVSWLEWAGDGRSVVYAAAGTNSRSGFWRQVASGGAPPELLFESSELSLSGTVSPDGRSLIAMVLHDNTWDLLRVDSGSDAVPYLASRANENAPVFSPDGRWLAYISDESGTSEVYVRSFPDPSTKVQVSAGGGFGPVWSSDGAGLFYSTLSGAVIEATTARSPAFRVISRRPAFPAGFISPSQGTGVDFALSRDSKQMLGLLPDARDFKLTVVPNWITEFRERVKPSGRR
jgi:Tol biopolymer transport system component